MKVDWDDFIPFIDIINPVETLGQKIGILEVLDHYGIEYVMVNTTQAKTKCMWHKDGQERTPSLYFYADTNSYHCFGCQANGNIIDFVAKQLGYSGCPETLGYSLAIEELCKMAGIVDGQTMAQIQPKPKRKPEETIEYYAIRAGNDIRKFLITKEGRRGYETWNAWADIKFKKLDKMLDNWTDDNWEKAQKYHEIILKQMGIKNVETK